MADYTAHYNLYRLTSNDMSPASFKFSDADRMIIDRLLYFGAEGHHHTGGAASSNAPASGPTLTLDTTSGALPSGTRIYYKFTFVDATGIETTPSPEVYVDTPGAVSPPGAPGLTTATTGGTLNPGSYFYIFTAYKTFNDHETTQGTAAHIAIPYTTSTNKITVSVPILPSGATGFNVYRKGPSNTGYRYLTSINMSQATPPSTFVDTGSLTEDPDRPLPTANTTLSSNSVIVTIPAATPTLPTGWLWRVYRTTLAGDYTNSLLITENTLPSITDTGAATSVGEPPPAGTSIGTPSKIQLTAAAEVQGILPVANGGTGAASATAARASLGVSGALARTAVKVADYSAAVGDLVPVDTTSVAVTITLPTAPATNSLVAVKHIIQGSTHAVTIACGGADVLNKAAGSTTMTLALVNEAVVLSYDVTSAVWSVLSDDSLLSITSFIRTLLDDTSASVARTTLGAAASAGQQFTGAVVEAVVTLTDGATINTDASLGNIFKVTLGGSRTMANPTNATAGQRLVYRLTQDSGGSKTITWDTNFRFGTDVTSPTLTITANKTDYLEFIYNSDATKWDCVRVARGY